MQTDVLIVGGGLSGFALAHRLQKAGRDFRLVEARTRLGGRIESCINSSTSSGHRYDLGPAWFWPGQHRMANLVSEFGLTVFEQYAEGNLVFEDETSTIRRDLNFATMAGSLRLSGGFGSLITALEDSLPAARIMLGSAVQKLTRTAHGIEAKLQGSSESIAAAKVVVAVPPRVIAETISFEPALSATQIAAMVAIPTWMAGHAKVIALYERPFWRDMGLSGDGMSRRGPLVEIHDASPMDGSEGALFGFVGIGASARTSPGFDLRSEAVRQLAALFGPAAVSPLDVLIADWAQEPLTATKADFISPTSHPAYGLPHALKGLWDGQLALGSTEMAPEFGGFLEGALEAAEALSYMA